MTRNSIQINRPCIEGRTIRCRYEISGPWIEAFNSVREFEVDYDVEITDVPAGIAIVPLLANVLPMSWIYDAKIDIPSCDADFLSCLPKVKRGYEGMYPMMQLGGELNVGIVEENRRPEKGAICFFSGGVDAFNTLIQHVDETPTLLTMRGADVKLGDTEGWSRVLAHGEAVARDFGVEFHEVASTFRTFLREDVLTKRVAESGDGWWHGFQHGLGLLGHAAPLAWSLGKDTVYIASSFSAADKGKYTCASDPTIDNRVRFCGARVKHDGYEFARQDKVRNIVRYSRNTDIPIKLRVCWESEGGSNCCRCEKCLRTILAIYAEGADPRDYGFNYSDPDALGNYYRKRYSTIASDDFLLLRHTPIQKEMRKNLRAGDLPAGFRWFYEGDMEELVHASLPRRIFSKFIGMADSLFS